MLDEVTDWFTGLDSTTKWLAGHYDDPQRGAMKAKSWKSVRQEAVNAGRIDEQEVTALKESLLAEVRAYKLTEVRTAVGLSQQELARQLEVSQSRISRIEHGDLDKTELSTLRKFAQALGGELELTLKLGDERFRLG